MPSKPETTPDTPAQAAARAWLHSYGINTECYQRDGIDHPAMRTLPQAFEAFALREQTNKPNTLETNLTGRPDGLHCVYGSCRGFPHSKWPCNPGCSFQVSAIDPLESLRRSIEEISDAQP